MNPIEDKYRDELSAEVGELYLIYGMIRAIKPEVCVEIGTHKGTSAWYISQALEHNKKGHLWTCDPFTYEGSANAVSSYPRTTFLNIKGEDFKSEQKIDFAFVDGFHDTAAVTREINSLLPQLNENAIVVFQDCQDEPTNWSDGVNGAIKATGIKTTFVPSVYGVQIYCHRDENKPQVTKKAK